MKPPRGQRPRGGWAVRVAVALCVGVLLPASATAQAGGLRRNLPASVLPSTAVLLTAEQDLRWEENVRFLRPNDTSDAVSRTTVGLVALGRAGRTDVALAGHLSGIRYAKLSALNGATYDAGMALRRRWTPRVESGLALAYATAQTIGAGATAVAAPTEAEGVTPPPVTTPGGAPVLLPLSISTVQAVSGTSSWRVTEQQTAKLQASYRTVSFNTAALRGGATADVRADYGAQVSQRVLLGFEVEAQRQDLGETVQTVTRAALGFNGTYGWGWARFQLGAAKNSATDTVPGRITPALSGRVRVTAGDAAFSVGGERAIRQAFGLGTLVRSDNFEGGVEYAILRRMTFRLSSAFGRSMTLQDGAVPFSTRDLTAELRSRPIAGLEVVVQIFDRQRDQLGLIANRGTSVQLRWPGGGA